MCDCESCVYGREVQHQLSLIPEEQRNFFEDLYERMCYESMDRSYYQAIVGGTWPSSEEILALNRRPNIPENFQFLSYDQLT